MAMTRREHLAALMAALSAGALASCAGAARTREDRSKQVVVIFGASGMIGRDLAKAVRTAGYIVRGVSRNPDRARADISADYEWVAGDVRDFASVVRATAGATYVVSTVAADQRRGPQAPEFIDWAGNRNLIDAAKAAGVRHFILISSATSGPQADQSQNPASGYVRYFKTKIEGYLRASGLSHTIIAPGRLKYEPGGTTGIRLLARKDYEISTITSGDMGLVVVDCLTNPAARGKAFALRNDDTLQPGAWRVMYAAMPNA
ncbi:MAG: SDR family oxidoreductase [Rhodospirillaceae bacterium]|nr:SDR family oxidoreductase [Rhodospirillaceae bacterium]